MLDVIQLRPDFPILQKLMRGKPFVYLDSGATSLKPSPVIEAEADYYRDYGVNIHRGVYEFSERATRLFADTRNKVARLINAPEESEVIFTHGSTESANLVAYSWARKFLKPGDAILTTAMEHHSNLVPWQAAAQVTGAHLEFIPISENGELDLSGLEQLMSKGVRLVAVSAMSNVSGYMLPLKAIIDCAHAHGALVFLDGAQYVSHHTVDVQALDCDFLIFSAHKMLGPTGVGVLWGKRIVLESMDPFMYGGDMILEVNKHVSSYQSIPEKFEAGTPNIAGVIGFSTALSYLEKIGLPNISRWEQELLNYTVEQARQYPWIKRYGPTDLSKCGGIFSFNVEAVHSHDIGTILDSQGIAVRTGFHCAMPYMEQLGVGGTVRASYYLYTSKDDIDRLFVAVNQAKKIFS